MLRGFSLIFASLASIIGLIFPYALARQATAPNQIILLAMLTAISGAFIHGVGFRPRHKWGDVLISPIMTWPVLATTSAGLIFLR